MHKYLQTRKFRRISFPLKDKFKYSPESEDVTNCINLQDKTQNFLTSLLESALVKRCWRIIGQV
ncbi:unnamed protein product [Brassica oleracea]